MVLVVVPAYNEEATIGRVIRGLFEHGFKDVVVVDDGSKDRTVFEAKKNGATVLVHAVNRGQGAALETGDAYARQVGAEVVVHFDGDDQFNPADITGAVALLKEKKLAAVLGSRFLDGRSKIPWFKKNIVLPVSKLVNFVFTGLWLTDVHNGFRVLSGEAVSRIVLKQDRMAHNTELLQQIKKQSLSFAEYPVEVRYSVYGQGALHGFRIIHDLLIGIFF